MEDQPPSMCSKCGNSPCLTCLMGDDLINQGHRYKSSNDVSNRQVRFRLYRIFTREMHGVLGTNNRIPRPECTERLTKETFPNEDGSTFVGHRSADGKFNLN